MAQRIATTRSATPPAVVANALLPGLVSTVGVAVLAVVRVRLATGR